MASSFAVWLMRGFPLWAVAVSIMAFFWPVFFSSLKSLIIPMLSVVMFGMGMTLRWDDFLSVLRSPGKVVLGVALQFLFMPLLAFLIAKSLQLSPEWFAGMILVGCSSGGTASNVITYLAKGDVALSICLTMLSTLVAVVAMPALTWLYLHQVVPVPVVKMFVSLLQIVLVPVLLGTAINSFWGQRIIRWQPVFPLISVGAIVLIIGIIVGLNQERLGEVGIWIFGGVVLHNTLGLLAGFGVPFLLKMDRRSCRTLAIEVGMQNSGLSVALAVTYFGAGAALPGAIFSIWHNLSGSVLAAFWSRNAEGKAASS